jgi:hypothetical protein
VIASFSDRIEVPKNVLVRFIEKESVFHLSLETECYFRLDEIGTRMWQVITAGQSIANSYAELLSEFDVEERLLRQNLLELLGQPGGERLLRIHALMWKRIRQFSALQRQTERAAQRAEQTIGFDFAGRLPDFFRERKRASTL